MRLSRAHGTKSGDLRRSECGKFETSPLTVANGARRRHNELQKNTDAIGTPRAIIIKMPSFQILSKLYFIRFCHTWSSKPLLLVLLKRDLKIFDDGRETSERTKLCGKV